MKMKAIVVTGWAIGAMMLFANPAFAQSGGDYDLSWSTIDGGGATSSGGDFTLSGTIGQPDAGTMTGGDYALAGGFWGGWSFCWVDLPELGRFLAEWLLKESEVGYELTADFNNDDEVNLEDYNIFVGSWPRYCPDNWPSW